MLYVALPDTADNIRVKSKTDIEIIGKNGAAESIKVIDHGNSSDANFIQKFISQNKNIKEKAIIASNAQGKSVYKIQQFRDKH